MPTIKNQSKKGKRAFDLSKALREPPAEEIMEEALEYITKSLTHILAYAGSIPRIADGLSRETYAEVVNAVNDIELTVSHTDDELARFKSAAQAAEDKYSEAYNLIQRTHVRCPQYGWQEVVHAIETEQPEVFMAKGDPWHAYQRLWERTADDGREVALYQKVKMEDLRRIDTGRGYDVQSYCKGCGAEVREVENPRKWRHWHPNINW